jgi:UDP-N-acetyl-D-glucosamine dehydrogenase
VPKVVGGIDEASTDAAAALYGLAVDTIHRVSSPEAAELTKLLENIFRSVNIALVNELAQLCDRMGIDIWEVVDAAATKPFGFMPFQPGPASAATASRSTRSTSPGRRASSTSRRGSSSSRAR